MYRTTKSGDLFRVDDYHVREATHKNKQTLISVCYNVNSMCPEAYTLRCGLTSEDTLRISPGSYTRRQMANMIWDRVLGDPICVRGDSQNNPVHINNSRTLTYSKPKAITNHCYDEHDVGIFCLPNHITE